MARKYICDGEKYEIGGPKVDTIGLPIFLSGLPQTVEVDGHTLSLKTSFHVSLVCIGKIAEKHKVSIPDFVNKVTKDFCEFIQKEEIVLLRFRDEFKSVVQNERRTLVAMCDVSNLDTFFGFLNKKYNLTVEYPPTHVTLYTLQHDAGIFLTDSDDIEKLTKTINNPGLVLI